MKLSDLLLSALRMPGKLGSELSATFRSLKNRDFRLYCAGQVVSLSGTWMQSIALAWLVYSLTSSATALGAVSFASGLPLLLLTFLGGIIADRFNRRSILFVTLTLALIQAGILAYLTYYQMISVPIIIGLAAAGGIITAIEMPTRQAYLPNLVGKQELTNAIGINSAIWNTSRTVGPALAGLLIGVFGEALCFTINAVSFLAAIFTLLLIRSGRKTERTVVDEHAKEERPSESVWSVLLRPSVRNILFLSAATSMFGFQMGVLLPVIVDVKLGGAAATLGLLSASAGIGALTGSLALANRGNPKLLKRGIGFACLGLSVAIVTIAFSPWLWLSMIATALSGACISTQLSGGTSLVQGVVNEKQRGRVMGVFSTCMVGFTPFAAMLAGWLAESFGLDTTLLISATCVAISALAYLALTGTMKAVDEMEN